MPEPNIRDTHTAIPYNYNESGEGGGKCDEKSPSYNTLSSMLEEISRHH